MNIHLLLMLCFFAAAAVVAIFTVMIKCGFFKSLVFSLFSGVGTLLVLHFTSLMTGIAVPVNAVSLAVTALGGFPGAAALALVQFFIH